MMIVVILSIMAIAIIMTIIQSLTALCVFLLASGRTCFQPYILILPYSSHCWRKNPRNSFNNNITEMTMVMMIAWLKQWTAVDSCRCRSSGLFKEKSQELFQQVCRMWLSMQLYHLVVPNSRRRRSWRMQKKKTSLWVGWNNQQSLRYKRTVNLPLLDKCKSLTNIAHISQRELPRKNRIPVQCADCQDVHGQSHNHQLLDLAHHHLYRAFPTHIAP